MHQRRARAARRRLAVGAADRPRERGRPAAHAPGWRFFERAALVQLAASCSAKPSGERRVARLPSEGGKPSRYGVVETAFVSVTRAAALVLGIVACAGWLRLTAQSQPSPWGGPAPAIGASDPDVARGERLYREGVGANGEPVPAIVQGDLRVLSTSMPCLNCHRRSGWGSSEGSLTVPSVTGATIFNPVTLGNRQMGVRTTGAGTRPGYDDRTLARAIRYGIDAAGRPLAPTMPRYALGEADQRALASVLAHTVRDTTPGGDGHHTARSHDHVAGA